MKTFIEVLFWILVFIAGISLVGFIVCKLKGKKSNIFTFSSLFAILALVINILAIIHNLI